MKPSDSRWERARVVLSPDKIRIGLALLSLLVMALVGGADEKWV